MKVIPPVAAILYLLAAWGVTRLLPNDPVIARSPTSITIAALFGACAIVLGVSGALTLFRHKTTVDPFGTPANLVTNGPFSLSRNPMYIAITLLLTGHGLFNGQAAFLGVPVAFLITASRYYVPREEKLLEELFPEEFRKYKEDVRRWI